MSFKLAGWAWDQQLPAGEKLLLLALADTANDDGECWPGRKRLAVKCGITPRSVTSHIKALQGRGLLRVEEQYRDDGSQTSSRYFLAPTLATVTSAVEMVSSGLAADTSHEPIREPIREPIPPVSLRSTSPKGARGPDIDALIALFPNQSPEWVREQVADAMNHKARFKYTDLTRYCANWIRKEIANGQTQRPGAYAGGGTAPRPGGYAPVADAAGIDKWFEWGKTPDGPGGWARGRPTARTGG